MPEILLQHMDVRRFGALHPELAETIRSLLPELDNISDERKQLLRDTARWIRQRTQASGNAELIFICTHNSRRSHLSQIWAQTFAWLYGLDSLHCYSGGTETTAFHPNALHAMNTCGFRINTPAGMQNPHHRFSFSPVSDAIEAWSKTWDDAVNPASGFAAIMTCSDADEACPIIPGADARFPIRYEDPKVADGTPREEETYLTRCRQIAAEMFYLAHEVDHGNE